ncbi:hypothetical protein E8E15_007838 [Penicillium rubens]|uniref:Pc21g06720 protein n=2 Tax=Penicillium chrysogenum species complex TaxID=254878 RepID=B6HJP1_PENRW|nr:uncharacterized protein N7525_007144 [Penicillium rubens]KZN88426.1 putative calcium-binding protein [Penicillium chrysogenum]CAP95569.1 Pc21g06720 [Penicillium rubens Wisconsin 54-1255]KAF3028089.1 hypothetical protein E8E15_007838 [Penicillium rubens]KAJ5049462.1 hypothetical protein NUH16_007981 [Penicillium rubens]KAJ5828891.1 hypothetical protein N7525_007144 [Penicillium rubens]
MVTKLFGFAAGLLALSALTNAHGSHSNDEAPSDDWATRHMIEEHHIASFDPTSFFILHDYDSSGTWTPEEIRKTYGLNDESNAGVSEENKQDAVRAVFELFDAGNTGFIDREDWLAGIAAGKRLPDLGFGPGHHGDLEYEYEIHHFEQYHGDDTTEADLTHPEDIEHFRKHDEQEDAAIALEKLEKIQVVAGNIPQKFRRNF